MAGAYQTGIYRNVLKECGYDETAIGERLEQTFETIFYGTEAQRFYHEAGGDMAYLEDTGNHLGHGGFAAAVGTGDDGKRMLGKGQGNIIYDSLAVCLKGQISQFKHILTSF